MMAILVVGGLSVYALLISATRHLDRVLVQVLEKALRREVHIESVEAMRPGKIRVTGLSIANGKTFADGVLLRAPDTQVQYRFWDLVRGRIDPVGSIESATITNPYLLIVRDNKNHFNLQELFPKTKKPPKASPFRGIVRLRGGTVRFDDFAARGLPLPQTNVLTALDVTVEAGAPPLMVARLSANGGTRAGRIYGQGSIEPETGGFTFGLRGDSDRLDYWSKYLANIRGLDVSAGRGMANVRIWKPRAREPISLVADVTVRDGVASTNYVKAPITGVTGRVTVRTGHPLETLVNLSAMAAGIPVRAEGSVFVGKDGRVALTARADGVTTAQLRRLTPVTLPAWIKPLAPASVQAQIYGPVSAPVAVANVQLSRAILYNSVVEGVNARVRYEDDVVYVPSLTATAQGRAVTARGQYNLRTKDIRLIAGVPGVSARALGLQNLPLTGSLATRVVVTGTSAAPEAGVLVTVTNGRFGKVPFNRLAARVAVSGRTIHVQNAVATLPGATIRARGDVGMDGPLHLAVDADGVNLGLLLPAVGYPDISGTAYFQGNIVGTISDPHVQGRARIFNADVRGNRIDYAVGRMAASSHDIHLKGVTVARYPAQGVISGVATIRRDGQVGLNMVAKLQTGRVESLLQQAGISPLAEGNVRTPNNVVIGGTLASPRIEGRVVVTAATVGGYPVNQASARVRFAGGVVEATDVEAISNAGGSIGATIMTIPMLRLRDDHFETPKPFTATSIHLVRFAGLGAPYARLTGALDITEGYISGTTEDPSISALVTVPTLSVNGEHFDNATARVRYSDRRVEVDDLSISRKGREIVSIPRAAWNEATRAGSAEIEVDSLAATDVLTVLKKSEWMYTTPEGRRVDSALSRMDRMEVHWENAALTVAKTANHGDVAGPLHLSVSGNNVSVDGAVMVTGLQMEDQKLDRVSLMGRAENLHTVNRRLLGRIAVPPDGFQIDSGDMGVSGRFLGTIGGTLDSRLDAINIPLSYTRLFLPSKYKSPTYALQGGLTVTVEATGDWDEPEMIASVSGKEIRVGNRRTPFSIRTSAIELRNVAGGAVLRAQNIGLLSQDHSIRFEGEVPFDWLTKSIPDGRPLNLTASVDEQGLDLLSVLFGSGENGPIEMAKGSVAGTVGLTGTVSHPEWNGYFRVADGAVKLRMLDTTFQNITADLDLDPDGQQLVVKTLSAESSSGKGRVAVVPGGTVSIPALDAGIAAIAPNLAVTLDHFRIEEKANGLGLGERVRGTLDTAKDAPVLVAKGTRGPLLKGTILLSDVEVLPPTLTPPAMAAAGEPAFVPSFDLTLVVGKNVWVRNPLFRVRMDDTAPLIQRSLRVTNTLVQPHVEGQLTSKEGTFSYPTARFRLTDADIRVHYPAVQDIFGAGGVEGASSFSISADAQARLMAEVSGRRQPVNVYLHVEGPTATAPATGESGGAFSSLAPYHITLRSSPSIPERQLVALITREDALQQIAQGGNTQDILRQETMNILQSSVLPEALSGLESRLGQAFGLESLSLDYTVATSAVSVTASKRIADRLVLTYVRPIGDSTAGDAYTVGLSYQIKPRLQLTLQQQKGPFLPTAHAAAVPTGESNIIDTQILIEGSFPF
jgi:autotransporter translocation and assembly factor TamB